MPRGYFLTIKQNKNYNCIKITVYTNNFSIVYDEKIAGMYLYALIILHHFGQYILSRAPSCN